MKTPTLRDLKPDRLNACEECYDFAVGSNGDFARIWDECPDGDWLEWMIEKFEIEFDWDAYWAKRKPIDADYHAQLKPIDDDYYAQLKPINDSYELQTADLIRSMIPNPFRK